MDAPLQSTISERPVGMTDLPIELKAAVAGFVDNPKSLVKLSLADKTFHTIVKGDEAKLCTSLCQQQIGDELMPLALALIHTKYLPDLAPAEKSGAIIDLVNYHFPEPDSEQQTHFTMTFGLCHDLLTFHHVIDHLATAIAGLALKNIPTEGADLAPPTEGEMHRFRKSLYMTQLMTKLFPFQMSPGMEAAARTVDRPAWEHTCRKFAPWELQQIRCVRDLVADHVLDVTFPAGNLPSWARSKSGERQLRDIVRYMGLAGLGDLKGAPQSRMEMVRALQQLVSSAGGSYGIPDPWFQCNDAMWLNQPPGAMTSLDATAILERYPEADSGPRDAWLHTLLQAHVDEIILLFDVTSDSLFRCDYHATRWGFAFWDRARLEQLTQGSMPSTESMLEVGDIWVPDRHVYRYTKFRKSQVCVCPQDDDSDSDY